MSQYVVLDLEMCKVPKPMRTVKYKRASETIQIGAVLVDENLQIIDRFNTYVKPSVGSIDGYIKNLTGITTFDIKDAPCMREALEKFAKWFPADAIAVSWSDNDANQIRYEIEAKEIHIEKFDRIFDNWIDCQITFGEKMHNDRQYRLSEALIMADIDYDENIHNGMVDAYNTALLFIKMKKEPELVLSTYLQPSKDEFNCKLGDMFPELASFNFAS